MAEPAHDDYLYRSSDFAAIGSNLIDQAALVSAIQGASLPAASLVQVTLWSSGADCCLCFAPPLTAGEKTTVDGIIAAHTGMASADEGVWPV